MSNPILSLQFYDYFSRNRTQIVCMSYSLCYWSDPIYNNFSFILIHFMKSVISFMLVYVTKYVFFNLFVWFVCLFIPCGTGWGNTWWCSEIFPGNSWYFSWHAWGITWDALYWTQVSHVLDNCLTHCTMALAPRYTS